MPSTTQLPAIYNPFTVPGSTLNVKELTDRTRLEFYVDNMAHQINTSRSSAGSPQVGVPNSSSWVKDLNQYIADIIIETTVQGASFLEVHLIDPFWVLLQRDTAGNCFTGATRFITDQGVRSLAEICDQPVRIRNRFGSWEDGRVACFGPQEIYRVTFSNGEVVETTLDHRWWQADGTRVTTEDLEQVPFSTVADVPEIDPEGVRHGIVYGDGTLSGNYSQWDAVNPEKDEALVPWFADEEREVLSGQRFRTIRKINRKRIGTHSRVALQPPHYKSLPYWCTPEYARGFIAGLIATDGNVHYGASTVIHQEGWAKARTIAELAVLGGCVVNSLHLESAISPYTGAPRELVKISLKPFSVPVLLPSHQANLARRPRRVKMALSVESVESTDRVESVYCVIAPNSESFTLANGLITSNCFFDVDDTGYLWPPIDVNFPPKVTDCTWRLCQLRPSTDLNAANIVLTFEDKIVSQLREQTAKLVGGSQTTRAEFIQSLIKHANDNPNPGDVPIKFIPLLPTSTFTTIDLGLSQTPPASAANGRNHRKRPQTQANPPGFTQTGVPGPRGTSGVNNTAELSTGPIPPSEISIAQQSQGLAGALGGVAPGQLGLRGFGLG